MSRPLDHADQRRALTLIPRQTSDVSRIEDAQTASSDSAAPINHTHFRDGNVEAAGKHVALACSYTRRGSAEKPETTAHLKQEAASWKKRSLDRFLEEIYACRLLLEMRRGLRLFRAASSRVGAGKRDVFSRRLDIPVPEVCVIDRSGAVGSAEATSRAFTPKRTH
uniref:Uncharacterized protein n=1 Tax=Knipowitschia caucasica TaxID=637954 RepID=A0AAV2LKQ3_KNICA